MLWNFAAWRVSASSGPAAPAIHDFKVSLAYGVLRIANVLADYRGVSRLAPYRASAAKPITSELRLQSLHIRRANFVLSMTFQLGFTLHV
jgi:hypothetical protein